MPDEFSLVDYYLLKCFGPDRYFREQQVVFRDIVRFWDHRQQYFIVAGVPCTYPEVLFLGSPCGGYMSCIVHGDLNTRNIFIAEKGAAKDVTLVDFSETGRGHVFFDFIVFEISVRLDMSSDFKMELDDLVQIERAINADQTAAVPYASYILKLRGYAWENFPDEKKMSYIYGVAVYCFSLLNASNLSVSQLNILAACICAASVDLQQSGFWTKKQ